MATPLANQYGRRPVYLVGNLIAAITNIVPGYCDTWAAIMATRAINGLTAGSVMAMGAATICDMYFAHQRGMFMGIYTLCLTNGSNVSRGLWNYPVKSHSNQPPLLDRSHRRRLCSRNTWLALMLLYSRLSPAWHIRHYAFLPPRDTLRRRS